MKLGFVTLPEEKKIRFAKEAGFDGIEAMFGRWAGAGFDLGVENAKRAKGLLDQVGIRALTVTLGENYATEKDPLPRLRMLLDMTVAMDCRVTTLNAWIPEGLKVPEKFEYYRKVWSELAKLAEDRGLKLAIENCPHDGHNLGNSPAAFRRMFELVPSPAVGLEFDPSHFIFQFMDYCAAIREFGSRVYAFHAKDTQILRDKLNAVGICGDRYLGEGWWRFRMPGYGDADWKAIFTALSDVKYDGDIIIEHEDPTYEGEEGLRRGNKFLRQFIL